jgi:hypothetical protein
MPGNLANFRQNPAKHCCVPTLAIQLRNQLLLLSFPYGFHRFFSATILATGKQLQILKKFLRPSAELSGASQTSEVHAALGVNSARSNAYRR